MATYNGERYITEQLQSILRQLNPEDEVILVDDGSHDDTLARVAALNDVRIHATQHKQNRGVVATFEDAVRQSTGEIIFFSDQDDIWTPDKVSLFLAAFAEDKHIAIVQSALAVIDEQNHPIEDPQYSHRRPFATGFFSNLYANRFQGAAMAIRRNLMQQVLPFPQGYSFFHDEWIGLRSAILGGRAIYLDQPLLLYRRHSQNHSKPRGICGKMKKRLEILLALARYRKPAVPSLAHDSSPSGTVIR
jgi:glycosyltransferase involved in cell wall biosynthesis